MSALASSRSRPHGRPQARRAHPPLSLSIHTTRLPTKATAQQYAQQRAPADDAPPTHKRVLRCIPQCIARTTLPLLHKSGPPPPVHTTPPPQPSTSCHSPRKKRTTKLQVVGVVVVHLVPPDAVGEPPRPRRRPCGRPRRREGGQSGQRGTTVEERRGSAGGQVHQARSGGARTGQRQQLVVRHWGGGRGGYGW